MATLTTLIRRAVAGAAPQDAALAALAVRYGSLIDNAAAAKKYAAALRWLKHAEQITGDETHAETIRAALAQHSVASDLGPKLLAALEALQLSPRSRSSKEAPDAPSTIRSELDELAGRRQRRNHPPTVDAPAP